MPGSASDSNEDRLGDILEVEVVLGTMLFEGGAAGQRIFDSLDLLNQRLNGPEIHVQVNFENISSPSASALAPGTA